MLFLESPEKQRRRPGATRIGIPRFRLPLKPRSIPAGFGCTLVCSVVGIPEPKVKWLRDGEPLPSDRYKARVPLNELIKIHY